MQTEITIIQVKKVYITHPDNFCKGELKQMATQFCQPCQNVSRNWDMTDVAIEVEDKVTEVLD